jgi:hypothetical protein
MLGAWDASGEVKKAEDRIAAKKHKGHKRGQKTGIEI